MRNLSKAVFAHLVIDLLITKVDFNPDTGGFQLFANLVGISVGIGNDCRHNRLNRCQPGREATCIMFDQDADKAFIAAKDRAVEHDGAVLCAILADIACVETFGQHAVGLDRADLPSTADRIGEMPFELGCVKCAFAGQFFPAILLGREAGLDDCVAQFLFGLVPIGVAAEALFGAQRQLDRIGKAEILVDPVCERAEILHFLHNLVFAAEDVGVVLRKLSHAHQAMERAMRLVAMAAAIFVKPQRQVAVGFDALTEDQDMCRAVHRLQCHPVGLAGNHWAFVIDIGHFVRDDEHIFAIFAPMA